MHSLANFRGKPVVVIFYLGFGCLHCVEQLQAFAPMVEDFQEAGISLVAISTEDVESMSGAIEDFSDQGTFPIPLVSDAQQSVFKAYRCFDDFEAMPLHGTFLIDADGFVRWHDISYEPFQDPQFLLKEASRLLSTPARTVGVADSDCAAKSLSPSPLHRPINNRRSRSRKTSGEPDKLRSRATLAILHTKMQQLFLGRCLSALIVARIWCDVCMSWASSS